MDPVTRTTSLLPMRNCRCKANDKDKFWGSLAVGSDGALYAARFRAAGVLRVDPATGKMSMLTLPDECRQTKPPLCEQCRQVPERLRVCRQCKTRPKWQWSCSLALGSDGAMYAAPFNATGVLRVDPATCTTSLLAADDDDESKPKPKTKPKTAHKTKKAATPKPTKAIKKKPIKLVRA